MIRPNTSFKTADGTTIRVGAISSTKERQFDIDWTAYRDNRIVNMGTCDTAADWYAMVEEKKGN